jgi:transcriptional regulator with XRE-family HTH domain
MLEFDGSKLKKLRQDRGLTQGELGEQVGKKTEHISNYENGYATPPSDVLLSLMKIFQISADKLGRPKAEPALCVSEPSGECAH